MGVEVQLDNKQATNATVSAAKLHVLNLEPIRARVDKKWPRLKELVHALFEKALKRAQGPLDHFLPVGELAYVVTFYGRSPEQAEITCAAVAHEVCELLFGQGAADISVRSVVGMVPISHLGQHCDPMLISEALEETGHEMLVTKKRKDLEHNAMSNAGLGSATYPTQLFPVWDLKRHTSSFFFLSPVRGKRRQASSFRQMLTGTGDAAVVDLEVALLRSAADYVQRVQAASQVGALAAGVSWETVSALNTRIRYIGALRAVSSQPNCPLLVKIDEVPIGMPVGRLAELTAMLAGIGIRVLIEFEPDARIPNLNIKLGAVGIGTKLPSGCGPKKAAEIISTLVHRVSQQSAFSFVGGLNNRELAKLAADLQVRFGTGKALDRRLIVNDAHASGIPSLPLRKDS